MIDSLGYYLNSLGVCCSAGDSKKAVSKSLFSKQEKLNHFMQLDNTYLQDKSDCYLGIVTAELPTIDQELSHYDSRNNRLLLCALMQIKDDIISAISKYGSDRVAVVIGTSTSAILEGEAAFLDFEETGSFPKDYCFGVQEISDGAEFIANYLGLTNMAMTVSTACSSSAKAFSHAAELISSGICDAVIVGGADSLCKLTVNGFFTLSALSNEPCNPFSINRSGISIGEGSAIFLMTTEPSEIQMMGVGESSDGYKMTAPDPEGRGAEKSMSLALEKANIKAKDISYINLHGTATTHNDDMEAKAVSRLFGNNVSCSSTKSLIGHTLGAAGALEAALCWLMLSDNHNPKARLLPHIWDDKKDDKIDLNNFTGTNDSLPSDRNDLYVLSNSFAFGGSNASLILRKVGQNDEI